MENFNEESKRAIEKAKQVELRQERLIGSNTPICDKILEKNGYLSSKDQHSFHGGKLSGLTIINPQNHG